jgi:hypothetical protein
MELAQAADFTVHRFEQLHQQGQLESARLKSLTDYYSKQKEVMAELVREGKLDPSKAEASGRTALALVLPPRTRCYSCKAVSDPPPAFCATCGAPCDTPEVRLLRVLTFFANEVREEQEAGRLSLTQAHDLVAATGQRMAALRQKLEKQRVSVDVPTVIPVPTPRPAVPRPPVPRRTLWEILLDPQSIQWLLGLGAALLVIGLVIWLAAEGIFGNPVVVAVALGLGNGALLAGGWAVIGGTRYKTAGRALTLLACLVMPLNLWFYHGQHLLTLDGHLWVAALVCCGLYAASALVLRDPGFVYVLTGGVALTGLLILAQMGKFQEIAAPSTLLVVLGLIAIHAEWAFPEGEGPFSRRRFGRAFFWSGQALLAPGLLLLLGGQLAGWLYQPLTQRWGLQQPPEIVMDPYQQLLAIALVLAGTYAYVYSEILLRRMGMSMYFAVFTLLWAEVLIVLRFNLPMPVEAAIIILALTALVANLAQETLKRPTATFSRAVPPIGLFVSTLPVLLGVVLHLRATNLEVNSRWLTETGGAYQATWWYVLAMLVTALCCRLSAHLYRHTVPWLSAVYFLGTAAATLVGAVGLLAVLGLKTWDMQAPLLMLVPIAYLGAARLYQGHTAENPLTWVAHVATAVMVVLVLAAAWHIIHQVAEPIVGKHLNLLLAAFFVEATLFYALASAWRKKGFNVYLGTVMACAAVWQLLNFWSIRVQDAAEHYTLAFAALGFVLLIVYRLAVFERFQLTELASAAFQSANALMSLSFLGALLLALSRLTSHETHWVLATLLSIVAILSLLAAGLVRHQVWRRWYVVMAITDTLLLFVTLHVLSHLTPWQKAEIFGMVIGVILLVLGHWGWYREQAPEVAQQSDWVSLALFLGSLLTGLPLIIVMLNCRYYYGTFWVPAELGMLVVGALLLATGFMFQLKSTTLIGALMTVLYVLSLMLFIHVPEKIQTGAIVLAVGGAAIFGSGLLLSMYRDRLLVLPEKIKRREGLFRVLSWR